MPGGTVTDLGSRLRFARLLKKLRLKDVAREVGCSESLLSKIECNKATPSLQTLHAIAAVLDTTVAALFTDKGDQDVVVYRDGERPTVPAGGRRKERGMRLERLIPHSEGQLLYANIHVLPPGTDSGGDLKHHGEEVGYVLEGELELIVSDRSYRLKPGDSFFFLSERPHRWRNPGHGTTRVVWVSSPPF